MGVRLEVDLAASAVGDMRVPLGCPEIRVAKHLLDRTEIGATLEQVSREGVSEEVGMHAARLETGSIGELSEDQERAGASQWAAPDVQEQLRAVAPVEMRAAEREVSTNGFRGRTPEGDEALFVALAEHADDSLFDGDATLLESDRLGHAQAGAVQELDERPVSERAGTGAGSRVDEALGLRGRESAWERARTAW